MKRFGIFAALGHLALVLLAMAVVALSRRSLPGAVLVYSPRVLLALPSLVIVPALALRGPRRWLWAQVLTLALVAGPFMGLHLSWPRPGPRTVRVLTWNVWFGAGDAAAVEATVREAGADIYLFQAAASEPDAALHELEGFHYLHEDQFVLASRWPARVNGMGPLARLHRSWVRFAVDAPFGRLEVISVHPHSPRELLEPRHGGWSRLLHDPEVEALVFLEQQLQQIDAETRGAGPLLVVAGDFNVPEGGALLRGLLPGTEDSFASAGNGYGYTFPVHGRWMPWMRLDRILTGPRLTAVRAEVTGQRGSDHAALLVDLALHQSSTS